MKHNLLKSIFISLILMMGVGQVWAYDQSAVDLYFDNSTAQWTNCYVYIGHGSYTSCYAMSRVSGTQYLWKLPSNFNSGNKWGGASGWVVSKEKWWDSNGEDIYKFVYHGNKNVTNIRTSAWNATTIYKADGTQSVTHYNTTCTVYKWSTSTKSDYTVTINSPTGGTLTVKDYDNTTVTNGTKKVKLTVLKFSATASTGYTFGGVQINNGSTTTTIAAADIASTTYTLASDVTITPIWTPSVYDITYKDQGNVAFSGTHASGYPTQHTYGTATTLKTATKTGYTFGGWFTNSGCTGSAVTSLGATAYTANITLYAKWTVIEETKYDVTISANANGSVSPSGSQQVGASGIQVTATPNDGYQFKQWSNTGGAKAVPSNSATTTVTATANGSITASFTEILTTVTLTAQPAEGGSFTVNGTSKASGSTVNVGVTTSYSVKAIANTGYTFDSWTRTSKVSAVGSGNAVTLNADGTGGTGTLYAKFKANTYTITYKDQGGSDFSGVHASGHPTTHTYGTATTLKDPTKTGYTFDGWFTTSACTGTAVTSLGATDYTSDITLYAKWTELPPTTVYFKPINDWKGDNTRFAVYYWEGSTNGWIDMTPVDCGGTYYSANILNGFTNIKFVSFPTDKANNWNYDINRTEDLKVPNDGKVLYDMASTNITHLYLKPNSNWKADDARFAAYFFKQGDDSFGYKWMSMSDSDSDGIYNCSIPTDKAYPNVIFCRMNGGNSTNDWNNKWNQTGDLTIPIDGKNLFDKPNDTWDGATTTWSTIYDDSKWTTFAEPTFDVIVHITGKGAIKINGTTYEGDSKGTTNRTIRGIAANETLSIGAITPKDHWAFGNDAQIQIGSQEKENLTANSTTDPICGNSEIFVTFTPSEWEVTFNLNLPSETVYPEDWTPNQYQYVAKNGTATEPTSVCEIGEYLFGGWYTNSSTFTDANKYDFSKPVTGDLTLYARWIPYTQCIFFKNNLDWGEVYVYTFSNAGNPWWGDETGVHPGTASLENGKKMTRMGESDIYYYVMNKESSNYTQESNANRNYIAFSNKDMSGYDAFYDAEAVFRGDHKKNLTLFVPLIKEEQKPEKENVKAAQKMKYYNKGLWMKYNSTESGYQMATDNNFPGLGTDDNQGWGTYGNKFEAETPGGYTFSITKHLEANKTYEFKLKNYVWVKDWEENDKNQWFAYNGTITQDKCTNLNFIYEESPETQYANTKITTTTAGDYTFHIYLGDGKVVLSVDYPLSVGDYQLWYTDDTYANDEHHKEERIIKKCNMGSRLDTISFFVRKDKNPKVKIYKCSNITGATKTWTHVVTLDNITVDATSVYNFVIEQTNEGGNHEAKFTGDYFLHEGDFYIRTDMAPGGWNSYKQESHAFTNFNKYEDETFNHYWVEYTKNANVKARIATDYSMSLSTELNDYTISNASVRFSYNNETNVFERAFLGGSSNNADFLRLVIDNADFSNGITFADISNWVYEVTTKVERGQIADVMAKHGNVDSGNPYELRDDVKLLGDSSSTGQQTIRVIYDFKKNRMICGWLPGDLDHDNGELKIDADMLVVRVDNGKASEIKINDEEAAISDLNRLYFVLELTRDEVIYNNKTKIFWFSLPFECKLKDVFGIEGYGTKWVVQRYRGDKRAELGFRPEIETFWANMKQSNTATLEPNRGYVLSLNLTESDFREIEIDEGGNKYKKSLLRLYFPSNATEFTLSQSNNMTVEVPEHLCTVQSIEDREPLDSHWNVIGIPGYQQVDMEAYTEKNQGWVGYEENQAPNFLYEWQGVKDSYQVVDGKTFKYQHFYSYFVQFAGTINWSQYTQNTPNPAAAPRRVAKKADKQYKVVLGENGANVDQTFVTLSEKGNHDYSIGNDLEKIGSTSVARIYTQEGNWNLAANHLSDTTTVLPLTLSIPAEGEYTLSLEQGLYSTDALLYDSENGTYTDLSKEGYTFTAEAGVNNERFALRFGMKLPGGNATDLQQTQAQYVVRIEGQRIIIEGMAGDVRLYDMTGRVMTQLHANDYTEITVPVTGVYVLQIGNQFEKMIIK